MKANVGGIDKFLRIVVGMALILWTILGGPAWAWLGVLPLATSVSAPARIDAGLAL